MATTAGAMDIDSAASDTDSGVSDMTSGASVSSGMSTSTIVGSPASSVAGQDNQQTLVSNKEGGSHNGAQDHYTHVFDQASVRSGFSLDSGFISDPRHLPSERVDSTAQTQEWVNNTDFDVFVKTLDGRTVTIQVQEKEEVVSFRKKVEAKTNVPESQQYLVTQEGRKMQDGERLVSYNVKKHSTIYCQGRLRGGNQ